MEFRNKIIVSNKNDNKLNNKFYKVYDKNGKFKKIIDVRNEKNLTDEFLYVVTCFVINELGEVLIEVRSNNTELSPGQLDLVSGHVNGNETGFSAIVRELREEVGIEEIDCNKLIRLTNKAKPMKFDNNGKTRNFHLDFFCLFTDSNTITKFQKEEINFIKWVPMELAFNMIKDGKTRFPKQEMGKVNYEAVFYQIRQRCKAKDLQESEVMEK